MKVSYIEPTRRNFLVKDRDRTHDHYQEGRIENMRRFVDVYYMGREYFRAG
jgi:hypothetical protein